MENVFKSSITRGGPILTPHIITISTHSFEWKRKNTSLIGWNKLRFLRSEVRVEINDNVWGCTLIFRTFGNVLMLNNQLAENFTERDAKLIYSLLNG